MKYVMIRECLPIVFTEAIQHDTFRSLGVTSAGFCDITWDEQGQYVQAYGESVSLRLKPAPGDTKILTQFMIK